MRGRLPGGSNRVASLYSQFEGEAYSDLSALLHLTASLKGAAMPIQNYSVLKGSPIAGKVVDGSSQHYQITVQTASGNFTVAVNIQSTDGSEVLYAIEEQFIAPDPAALAALPAGFTSLQSQPGGLALDFVREQINGEPMITQAQMTLLPIASASAKKTDSIRLRAAALANAVTTLIGQAIHDGNATVYAFGSAYADSGATDGIHDIHMNQGNPDPGRFARDNGTWQDGALFLNMPSLSPDPAQQWVAIFLAFQSESWQTDDNGNPA
jgi:uncharacterized protein YukJ